jgi:small ligand-binding sensory domain FIST
MKAGGALVLTADAREAASRAAGEARASLGGLSPTFAVLFASAHFFGSAQDLVTAVADETGQIPLIGCVAEAVAGGAREVESGPAVALWLAAGLGPVETFGMEFVRTPTGGAYGGRRPAGALLFTCNGRGSRLFSEPDHDAGLLARMLGEIPVAGFFCAGELGPVGGQNYLHAFTASIALFPGSSATGTSEGTAIGQAVGVSALARNWVAASSA